VGKERPLLDILRNSETFDELAANGFELVRNSATRTFVDQIMPAL
jgi:hypothetical protein